LVDDTECLKGNEKDGVTVGGQSEWGGVAEQSWQQLGSDLTKSDQGSDAVQEFNAKGESGRGVKSESWC
jgi:hypothetical protein